MRHRSGSWWPLPVALAISISIVVLVAWPTGVTSITKFLDDGAPAITAIATGFVAWFTIVLARVARKQQAITEVLERAYVSVEPLGIACRKDGPWFANVGFKNAGRLPARDVRWEIHIERFCYDEDWNGFTWSADKRKGPVIPPGTTVRRASKTFHVDTRYSSDRFMYVWGEVTYTDGFGCERSTKFCHRYNSAAIRSHPTKGGMHIPRKDARYHDHGNEAT